MKVRIIKGTKQIGGCITEVSTNKAKIIIDFGEDLVEDDEKENIMIPGLNDNKISMYDAVFITHSHGDHIGLVNSINKDIKVYVEETNKAVHNLTCAFVSDMESITRETLSFGFGETITVGDIFVTPYIVDHSAYNSCMFLIECDGKRIVHTGDFRGHGKKGKLFLNNVKKIGGKVDLLITEGTVFGRDDEEYITEDMLVEDIYKKVKDYKQVLVMQSSTNIDRVVTMMKVANKKGIPLIQDLFTAVICNRLGRHIPNTRTYTDVYTWTNSKYFNKEKYDKYVQDFTKYKNKEYANGYMMLVKSSMFDDIKRKLYDKGYLDNACIVYSMWNGYLEKDYTRNFIDNLKDLGVDYIYAHTSGHSDILTMKKVNELLKPKMTLVIHTENGEKAKEVFDNVLCIEDDMEVEV